MRKYYLDNLRYGIVLLVILYHIIYVFNSAGVVSNISVPGIPQMDALLYFVYPWFMALMFLISGTGTRYALEHKTGKLFLKNRAKSLLIPSITGIFILGWVSGYITSLNVDMFGGNGGKIPGVVKYLIYSFAGIGPLWFAHELFLATLVLLLIRVIDKKDRLLALGARSNLLALVLLFFPVWGSAQILNTPLLEVYRHGIYIFMFLLGYYVFSHNHVQETLLKYYLLFSILAVLCGVIYSVYYFGENYASYACLKTAFTNLYAWLMILALLGFGRKWLDKKTRFTGYMAPRSFGFYVLHYPLLIVIAYLITSYMTLPVWANYVVLFIAASVGVPLFYEIVSRIPVLRYLLLYKKSQKSKA